MHQVARRRGTHRPKRVHFCCKGRWAIYRPYMLYVCHTCSKEQRLQALPAQEEGLHRDLDAKAGFGCSPCSPRLQLPIWRPLRSCSRCSLRGGGNANLIWRMKRPPLQSPGGSWLLQPVVVPSPHLEGSIVAWRPSSAATAVLVYVLMQSHVEEGLFCTH